MASVTTERRTEVPGSPKKMISWRSNTPYLLVRAEGDSKLGGKLV